MSAEERAKSLVTSNFAAIIYREPTIYDADTLQAEIAAALHAAEKAAYERAADVAYHKRDEYRSDAEQAVASYHEEDKSDPKNATAWRDHDLLRWREREFDQLGDIIRQLPSKGNSDDG